MSGTDDGKGKKEGNPNPGDGGVDPNATVDDPVDPGDGGGDGGGADDISNDPAKAKKEIERLRKEAAANRVKAKELEKKVSKSDEDMKAIKKQLGIETDDMSPEDKIKERDSRIQQLEAELHLSGVEEELGITKAERNYFRFLVNQKGDELDEGDELSDEQLAEIVKEVKSKSGKGSGGGTGVGGGKKPDPAGGNDALTLEQFRAMSVVEQSKLYIDNPDEYKRLMTLHKKK